MLTSMSNAVITINDEGKIITCNKSGLKILKIRDTDILGKSAEDFLPTAVHGSLNESKNVRSTRIQSF